MKSELEPYSLDQEQHRTRLERFIEKAGTCARQNSDAIQEKNQRQMYHSEVVAEVAKNCRTNDRLIGDFAAIVASMPLFITSSHQLDISRSGNIHDKLVVSDFNKLTSFFVKHHPDIGKRCLNSAVKEVLFEMQYSSAVQRDTHDKFNAVVRGVREELTFDASVDGLLGDYYRLEHELCDTIEQSGANLDLLGIDRIVASLDDGRRIDTSQGYHGHVCVDIKSSPQAAAAQRNGAGLCTGMTDEKYDDRLYLPSRHAYEVASTIEDRLVDVGDHQRDGSGIALPVRSEIDSRV